MKKIISLLTLVAIIAVIVIFVRNGQPLDPPYDMENPIRQIEREAPEVPVVEDPVQGDITNDNLSDVDVREGNLEQETPVVQRTRMHRAYNESFKNLDGDKVMLSDFDTPLIVANAWATWCPFCVTELPEFAEVQKEFPDDVTIVAINRKQSLKKNIDYVENRLGLLDDLEWWLDSTDTFYESTNGFGMPVTLIFSSSGKKLVEFNSVLSKQQLIDAINEQLSSI